ncbi:hypothetical protein ATSB10_04140 [Dyella thiooxydans]|uniref:Uncharacterized protein n=1 Tax=Dyella thiooxydans TaxID=445710 RepID=A0A160MYI7_9GAMM|nr:hypothetical protein ATSB10_04140 [Dyella thiooxydans]
MAWPAPVATSDVAVWPLIQGNAPCPVISSGRVDIQGERD